VDRIARVLARTVLLAGLLAAAARPALALQQGGEAAFMGYVTDQFGQPVGDAEVSTADGGVVVTTRSTAEGVYRLDGATRSTRRLRVRRVGYLPLTVTVAAKADAMMNQDIEITKLPDALDPPRVQTADGELRADPRPFAERRAGGVGVFIDRAAIDRGKARSATDLLRPVSGFRVVTAAAGGVRLVSARKGGDAPAVCEPRLFVDGVPYTPADGVDDFGPEHLESIEAYPPGVEPPAAFRVEPAATCGTINLWLRR
jgi:hypothetical protein